MISIQLEPYSECIAEMSRLYPAHYDELSLTKQLPLNPQYEAYKEIERQGILKTITVRDGDLLVGYLLYMLAPDLHYGGIMAAEDIYYLMPEYRGRMIGSRLFEFYEKCAKEQGARKIFLSTKVHSDNSSLFERRGFKPHEKLFVKVI